VTTALSQTVGISHDSLGGGQGGDKEIAWAFRRLIESVIASRGPLALVFEDIHWAEPPLLDLIEYLVTWTRDAPLLVVALARPELLDSRVNWGSGRMEASRIHLEPLTEQASRELLGALLTVDDLPAELRQRVLDRAEGNPLFVEEVVRMLIEGGAVERRGDRWLANRQAAELKVPDSVESLIRARLDTLPAPERSTMQAASVVGRIFQRSAVAAIVPTTDGSALQQHLQDAILRDLITDERAPDEPTFRFRHILIRDVAYATLPKARRADLHLGVADWLRAWADDRIEEFLEIEAYHLEQAAILRRELGNVDRELVERAARALAASARKALSREDDRAVLGFAERALGLEPLPGEERLEAEWLRLEAFRRLSQFREAEELALKVEGDAKVLGRRDIEARAVLAHANAIWLGGEVADLDAGRPEMERARELLTAAGDTWYLLTLLGLMAFATFTEGDVRGSQRMWVQFTELARENGWSSREALSLVRRARMHREFGEMKIARQLLTEAANLAERGPSRRVRIDVEHAWGVQLMLDESDELAEQRLIEAAKGYEEFGERNGQYNAVTSLGGIAMRTDRPAEALAYFRTALTLVEGNAGDRPEALRNIAQALLELGEVAEAAYIAEQSVAQTAPADVATSASSAMVLGLVREAQGETAEAERLLRQALATVQTSDYNPWEEQLSVAEFTLRRGRHEEGQQMLALAHEYAARYGEGSPLVEYVDRRGDRARHSSRRT
jgi:hypothetical protein